MTPVEFAEKYVDIPLDEYVCLVHDPRPEHPFGKTYTVEFLGNIVGGEQVVYLNVDIETMKRAAVETLEEGEPVWFGCDVGKQFQRQVGLWDAELFDYDVLYGEAEGLDKAGRLHFHHTAMTHAMLFTGVDVLEGIPQKWRVENSWGDDHVGRKGFQLMNDSWFEQYVFEIATHRSKFACSTASGAERATSGIGSVGPDGRVGFARGRLRCDLAVGSISDLAKLAIAAILGTCGCVERGKRSRSCVASFR